MNAPYVVKIEHDVIHVAMLENDVRLLKEKISEICTTTSNLLQKLEDVKISLNR